MAGIAGVWGGDPGYAWRVNPYNKLNAVDKKAKTMKDKICQKRLGRDVHVEAHEGVPCRVR